MNAHCYNKGKTCQQNKKSPNLPNLEINYYPISSDNFLQWNKELLSSASTVKQPSQNIIVNLVNWKERSRGSRKEQVVGKEDSILLINNLFKAFMASYSRLVNYLPSQLYYPYPPLYVDVKPPQNSSPIQLETDPIKLLSQFFKWLVYKLRQEKIYQHFCSIWQHLAAKCAFRALQRVAYGID